MAKQKLDERLRIIVRSNNDNKINMSVCFLLEQILYLFVICLYISLSLEQILNLFR